MQSGSSSDNPVAARGWPALLLSVVGLGLLTVGLVIASKSTDKHASLWDGLTTFWGYAGITFIVGGLIGWVVAGLTITCPFCNQRISRKDYPRSGYFCPKCGKTVGGSAKKQAGDHADASAAGKAADAPSGGRASRRHLRHHSS
ncbi:MAG: hypothetical protein JXL80_10410 [Planctomycetes bacterium]|nr:hypothetical protein [Planctomycetota bacterium]